MSKRREMQRVIRAFKDETGGPRDMLDARSKNVAAMESDPMGEISKSAEEILAILNREMAGNHVFAGIQSWRSARPRMRRSNNGTPC